jgi:hypothetical protein
MFMKNIIVATLFFPVFAFANQIIVNNTVYKLDNEKLSPAQSALVNAIGWHDSQETVRTALDEAIFEKQGLNEEQRKTAREFISQFSNPSNPIELKLALEKKLKERNNGNPLVYNNDATSITSPLFEGRLQGASGSLLYTLAATHSASWTGGSVVIFSKGHMRPGLAMSKDFRPGKGPFGHKRRYWVLDGIETTADGQARVEFGPTASLPKNITVVNAHDYLLAKALEGAITNVDEVKKSIIEVTMKRFQLPRPAALDEKEKQIAEGGPLYGASIFEFGKTEMASGDLKRPTFNSIKSSADYHF